MVKTCSQQKGIQALLQGEAIIFPTDTVYGVAVAVDYVESPALLFQLKERSSTKPIAWLVDGVDHLDRYGKLVPDFARALARTFWPGPLTLIVRASSQVPSAFRSAEGTVGLRMPNSSCALGIIRSVGCPLVTSSANFAGLKSPHALDELDPVFAERVGLTVAPSNRDGQVASGVASTVVDCTHEHPLMVRLGAITFQDIQAQT